MSTISCSNELHVELHVLSPCCSRLVLQASDRGSPVLTGTSIVRVQVVDVNDNSPAIPPMQPVVMAESKTFSSRLCMFVVERLPHLFFVTDNNKESIWESSDESPSPLCWKLTRITVCWQHAHCFCSLSERIYILYFYHLFNFLSLSTYTIFNLDFLTFVVLALRSSSWVHGDAGERQRCRPQLHHHLQLLRQLHHQRQLRHRPLHGAGDPEPLPGPRGADGAHTEGLGVRLPTPHHRRGQSSSAGCQWQRSHLLSGFIPGILTSMWSIIWTISIYSLSLWRCCFAFKVDNVLIMFCYFCSCRWSCLNWPLPERWCWLYQPQTETLGSMARSPTGSCHLLYRDSTSTQTTVRHVEIQTALCNVDSSPFWLIATFSQTETQLTKA